MRGRWALAIAVAALACSGASSSAGAPQVLTVEWGSQGRATLGWADPHTLQPLPGGRLVSGDGVWPLARSPGGRYLLTESARTDEIRVRVVDLSQKQASPLLRVSGVNGAHAVWAGADRVVLVVFSNGQAVERLVLAIRPLRVLRRTPLSGQILSAQPAGRHLVVLLGKQDRIGPVRLLLVGQDVIRSVALPGVRGGSEHEQDGRDYRIRMATPALAVDEAGRRAVVVGLGNLAAVDLAAMRVATHALTERRLQKRAEGWMRSAVWLDRRHVAVSGVDYEGNKPSPAGLRLVGVDDGTARPVDATASFAGRSRSLLLAWGRGLSAYGLDGTLRYRIEDGGIGDVMIGPTYLYVNDSRNRTRFRVVDPLDGRVVAEARTPSPTFVVGL